MQSSIQTHESAPSPTEPAATPRLRTVTGNRWPRKCSCGCGFPIPRDPEIRYVVDFGAPRPFPAYLREHSPDYRKPRGTMVPKVTASTGPAIVPAIALPRDTPTAPSSESKPSRDTAHSEDPAASPSPEAGRAWASGQLVFNAGSFESARSGFADYAREGETAAQLRARVNRVLLEDLEAKVLALRALHEKLRDRLAGPSLGDVVARGRPA
jgi:hypothetical protein